MSEIKEFYDKIKTLNKNENDLPIILKNKIENEVKLLFQNLNKSDRDILNNLSFYLTYYIKNKFLFNQSINAIIDQFSQNNNRDIKAIILLILPFISDKDNFKKFKLIFDLNQILYYPLVDKVDKSLLNIDIKDTLKNEFQVCNFGIGLINENEENLLELIDSDNVRLIDKLIFNNYMGLFETIKMVNGKLYINWINVTPLLEENYSESYLFKSTVNYLPTLYQFNEGEDDEFKKFERNYNGIWIGDLYNVLRNGYYQNIKKNKWLIYFFEGRYFIQILDSIFDFSIILDNKYQNYDSLPESVKVKLSIKLENFILSEDYSEIKKTILIFLVNNYKYRYIIDKDKAVKIFIIKNILDDGFDDDFSNKKDKMKFDKFTKEEVLNAFKSIGIAHFWDFLKESLDSFKDTIYASFVISDNMVDQKFKYIKINNKVSLLSLKNIYNIAKILSHDQEFKIISNNFISLNDYDRKYFYYQFYNNTDIDNWLKKLNKNIKRENPDDVNIRISEVKEGWINFRYDFIFIYLIKKGLLSEFQIDTEITNTNNLPYGYKDSNKKIEKLMKEKFAKNKNWSDAYYFIKNKKFSDLENIRVEKPIVNIIEKDYFDFTISSNQKWYRFYAMDWLTQIKFFHKFIYNQVLYVTGATGQGKSTQVPKLLLYALKMIDYKENGKIICTQPRIPPTIENAETISLQLGVPIIQPNYNNSQKLNTSNYYIQYKYQEDSHTLNSNKFNLKIVTDGTLFVELKNNIFMKEKIPTGDKKKFKYGKENYYDIIIVDEAHEHNRNMDLILTMARNSVYCNNDLKLVIVSATMDDDEPIYRSYFKQINENIMYPIKQPILSVFTNSDDYIFLNTIFMDRRFDISPPGMTTQYNIEEFYSDIEDDPQVAQNESFQKVLEICNQTTEGEILLFSTGQMEILNAVEYLNKRLPANVVALPYFGRINSNYKNIIQKIDKNISKIRNKKERIHIEWQEDFYQDNSVPEGIYKRSVIVATNVAEASVTIPRLKFVIDNGYSKEAKFDDNTETDKFTVEKISEASRIQRRGRVGRISDGYVYYMYPKNARSDIKPKYKINQQKVSEIYTQLSSLYDNESESILPKVFDPHNEPIIWYSREWGKYERETEAPGLGDNVYANKLKLNNFYNDTGLESILIEQFYVKEWLLIPRFFEKYFPSIYDYYQPGYIQSYRDGFTFGSLIDKTCIFYLIHPKENEIIRNSANKIIKTDINGKIKLTNDIETWSFYRIFELLSINLQICMLDSEVGDKKKKIIYKKTLLGDKFEELKNKLPGYISDDKEVFTLMYGYGLGVLDEVIMVLALLKSCNYSVKRLATSEVNSKGKKIFQFDKLKENFKSSNSDIESLFKICNLLKNNLSYLLIFNLDIKKEYYLKLENQYNLLVSKFKEYLEKGYSLYNPPSDLINDWNLLNKINREGKLGNKLGFLKWLSKSKLVDNIINSDLESNLVEIKKICEINYLEYTVIIEFLRIFFKIKNSIYTIDKDEDFNVIEKNPFQWIDIFKNRFNSINYNLSIKEKIDKAFIFGFCKSTCIKLSKYSMYKPIINTLTNYSIEKLSRVSKEFESFLTNVNSSIIYLNITKNETIRVLINVMPQKLSNINPLYFNKLNFKNIDIPEGMKIEIFEYFGEYYENFIEKLYNSYNVDTLVFYENYSKNKDYDFNMEEFIKFTKKRLILN